jgi:hypothetical protein
VTPTPVFVAALLALAALGVPVAFGVVPPGALAAAAIVLAVVAALDAWRLRRLPTPTVERELPSIVPVGVEREVALRLRHDGAETLRADVHDLHPGAWPVLDLPQRVDVPPQRESRLVYRLTPTTRGRFDFDGCALRLFHHCDCGASSASRRCGRTCACIRISRRWRGSRWSARSRPRAWSARISNAAVARAPSSSNCANTASAIRCARSTGRRASACAS